MNISINRNIDEFRDDFYKGLSFRQTCFSVLTVGAGGVAFVLTKVILGIPQMIAVYITIAAAAPWAVWGFIKIRGMPANVYLKKTRKLKKVPILLYRSTEGSFRKETHPKTKEKKQKKQDRKVMLCPPQEGMYS